MTGDRRADGRPCCALILDGNSGPALAAARSLGSAGWRVLASAGTRSAVSRHVAARLGIPAAEEAPRAFGPAVANALEHEAVDVVVPCTDASLTLLYGKDCDLGGARVLGGTAELTGLLTDKAVALRAAEQAGFPVPRWFDPSEGGDVASRARELGFPCVLKPRRSYVPENGRLQHLRHRFAHDEHELDHRLREMSPGQTPLVQEYVGGRALSVGAVISGGRVLARIARETLSFHPIAGGNSVWKRTVPPDDAGVQAAVRLLVELDYEGVAEVEYQVDHSGTPRFMEVGARLFGWVPLARKAGVDLPLIGARALVGLPPGPAPDYEVGLEMRWPAGEIARIRDVLRRAPLLPPGVSRADVLARAWPPWRPGMRYDGIEPGDMAPWLPRRLRRTVRRAR